MTDTTALDRIATYYEEFRQSVERCCSAKTFMAGDWKGAYDALYRLKERYRHEKGNLTREQRAALYKAFEDDAFIGGMMELRQVGTHVARREGPTIYTTGNAPITLTAESSAMAVFGGPIVRLLDNAGKPHTLDHAQRLQAAERRIGDALVKAGHR
jgi:hypothetical protein